MEKIETRIIKKCPICDKRVFDILDVKSFGEIELKCPHCHKIVRVKIA